jgi:mono/diheme cytochrome c family protein
MNRGGEQEITRIVPASIAGLSRNRKYRLRSQSKERTMTVSQKRPEFCRIGIAVLMLLATARDGVAADSMKGQRLAVRICTACHLVLPGQQQALDHAPTFGQIAASQSLDERALKTFLADPEHSRMPNLSLTDSEIADLVAYIRTLAPAKPSE